ncbi:MULTISPECIES: hypothetical protein [unclassified Undibacterium]|uniref:hypothetical protein n=1 Tax=unclassified Undibacterium TaxID=2630295 RepID=UPI002AC907AB|nr:MULTISPECIES: hypothetical protein [unclassified Undibacterium]MEB0137571.1 hypothetical protein [Undibacterium sp. CCC2.1]MEB0170572.1 hypothetical protein [Undibacterium sp. CCC1.1]MEB0174513.1 hypothetical protein [Undibacterium sp. CCC3.4]MEB0213690.1 hypothetical protein [Undibacterium sp. 5I2]WPX43855.1 hypothetical protein RHM61_01070 [Undibacterium sp. CCC3.4]
MAAQQPFLAAQQDVFAAQHPFLPAQADFGAQAATAATGAAAMAVAAKTEALRTCLRVRVRDADVMSFSNKGKQAKGQEPRGNAISDATVTWSACLHKSLQANVNY